MGATADFANQHQQLGPKFADKEGNRGFIGPASYAIDGKNDTAWGIDSGPGRRNASRKAVFVTDENIAFAAGTNVRDSSGADAWRLEQR